MFSSTDASRSNMAIDFLTTFVSPVEPEVKKWMQPFLKSVRNEATSSELDCSTLLFGTTADSESTTIASTSPAIDRKVPSCAFGGKITSAPVFKRAKMPTMNQ